MAERIRVGVVGTSWWADLGHLPGLTAHPGADVVAICGRNRPRAEEVARKYAIPGVFTDYREMIARGGLQALLVLTPDDSHCPIVMDALDARLHVLCEKPLARSAAEARAMYEKAEAVGVKHMTHFSYRFLPPFRHLHDLVADGYVGRRFHCDFRLLAGYARDSRYRWRYDRQRGHGTLGDLGSHLIDLARWCAGDITRVSAHLSTMIAREGAAGQPPDPANDVALLAVEFRDGAQGLIQASAVAFLDGQWQEAVVHGEDGAVTAVITVESGEVHGARGADRQARPLAIPDALWGDIPPASTLMAIVEHAAGARSFIDAILADRPVSPSFYDGFKAQEVVDAAFASAEQGRWVTVGE